MVSWFIPAVTPSGLLEGSSLHGPSTPRYLVQHSADKEIKRGLIFCKQIERVFQSEKLKRFAPVYSSSNASRGLPIYDGVLAPCLSIDHP